MEVKVVAILALASTVSAGRHAASRGLLQMPPAFAHDAVHMYPALHPEHDSSDLNHLIPEDSKQLYYSQEGHRSAMHGAKHAQLNATFSNPTVVLEHSQHVKDVTCSDDHIQVCFDSPDALTTVKNTWVNYDELEHFNLVTYFYGCGHETGEHRSFFYASDPVFNGDCVTVATELAEEKEVIHEGHLEWGTYVNPHLAKRTPVRGHVKFDRTEIVDANSTDRVDLTKDGAAVKDFFGAETINTDIPDEYMTGLDSFSDEEYENLIRRGLFSWIVEGIKSVFNAVFNLVQRTVQAIRIVAQIVIAIAVVTVKLMMVPFGVPFEQSYHADIDFDERAGGAKLPTDIGSFLGGTENKFVLSKAGAAALVECESCGAKAKFNFDGKLSFSITKGIYDARISFINEEAFIFDAIYKITVDAKAFKNKAKGEKGFKTVIEKELVPVPFTPFTIPKIITIGPQAVISAAVSFYVDAHGEFRAGARFSVAPGRLVLDAVNKHKNEASGFKPSLEPIFEIVKGNIVATVDLATPVGIEVALDILSGTWKKAIGVYTAPSIYFTATASKGEGKKCNNGVELRAGAKNRVYTSALGLWEYEFKALGVTFFETGIGCLSKSGWDSKQVEPTETFFTSVANKFGGQKKLASSTTVKLKQPGPVIHADEKFQKQNEAKDKKKLRKLPKTSGFRVIQDASQTATLVSGKDGYIYMVNNTDDYDISAPWGGIKVKENIFSYDVFGRLIWFKPRDVSNSVFTFMTELGVAKAEAMPKDTKAASLSVIKDKNGKQTYGVSFKHLAYGNFGPEEDKIWYPTVCKTGKGLRLFATKYVIDEDGIVRSSVNQKKPVRDYQLLYAVNLLKYKLPRKQNACVTVRLTSDPKSTV